MSTYFSIVSGMLLGKTTPKYTDNPMTKKILPDVPIDDTYIIVKNVVDQMSVMIAHPYDYVKKCIIKKNENDADEIVFNAHDLEEYDNNSEDTSLITISYDTIYKADDETEQPDDNIETFVKTAKTAYTFVVSTYNDAVT